MQKRMVHASVAPPLGPWLDLDVLADVELTSEDTAHPVEAALVPGDGSGWRASQPGTQRIRLLFHRPQRLLRIRLRFDEADTERTQEFTLRWSPDGGRTFREVVRPPSGDQRNVNSCVRSVSASSKRNRMRRSLCGR